MPPRSQLCRVDLDSFRQRAGEYDATVARCSDLDRFCSSSDWVLPAHDALMPPREPLLFEDRGTWIMLARRSDPRGFTYIEPLEACWGLTCPIVGASVAMLLEVCRLLDWDVLVIAGLTDESPTQLRIKRALVEHFEVGQGGTTTRHVADLRGGFSTYLARRTRNFRRSLQRSRRSAANDGVEFEVADSAEPAVAYARILDVDARSWKGKSGQGIDGGGMRGFYSLMIERLAQRKALRLQFARCEGHDVAFILGGIFAGTYRGLQFGYDADYAHLGLGNICQYEQMVALCDEGVDTYDLGTTAGDYKRRWCDRVVTSSVFMLYRRPDAGVL